MHVQAEWQRTGSRPTWGSRSVLYSSTSAGEALSLMQSPAQRPMECSRPFAFRRLDSISLNCSTGRLAGSQTRFNGPNRATASASAEGASHPRLIHEGRRSGLELRRQEPAQVDSLRSK